MILAITLYWYTYVSIMLGVCCVLWVLFTGSVDYCSSGRFVALVVGGGQGVRWS